MCPFPMQRSDAHNINASTTKCLMYWHSVDSVAVEWDTVYIISWWLQCLLNHDLSARLQSVSSIAMCQLSCHLSARLQCANSSVSSAATGQLKILHPVSSYKFFISAQHVAWAFPLGCRTAQVQQSVSFFSVWPPSRLKFMIQSRNLLANTLFPCRHGKSDWGLSLTVLASKPINSLRTFRVHGVELPCKHSMQYSSYHSI